MDLARIEMLVLDEADRMLDMGFKPQLDRILAGLPKKRQTMLFSATIGAEVSAFARSCLVSPVKVEISRSGTTAARAEQEVYLVSQNEKSALLLSLLSQGEDSVLVFTRTKRRADKVAKAVEKRGFQVARIHADRSQGQRRQALDGFREGKYRVLIATDIAARGIDVEEIGRVINYDLPHVPEDYVHRIGRTARASAAGHASSFVSPDEVGLLRDIQKFTRKEIRVQELPSTEPVFIEERSKAKEAAAHPGPSQPNAGRSGRPHGQPPGRHARSHPRKSGDGSHNAWEGAPRHQTAGGDAQPRRASTGGNTPTSGTWRPKRRR